MAVVNETKKSKQKPRIFGHFRHPAPFHPFFPLSGTLLLFSHSSLSADPPYPRLSIGLHFSVKMEIDMAVEAVVALMVDKLAELLSKDTQLLGLHGEINRIQEELNQMRTFLKDADIKQKEVEVVRDWMEDIRDVCFYVDDVIDILGQGQAAQGRHGFVERLKRCISDQITRYKVSKEIERIKLSIKGISRSRESYGIREINEERPEAASLTQHSQEGSGCSLILAIRKAPNLQPLPSSLSNHPIIENPPFEKPQIVETPLHRKPSNSLDSRFPGSIKQRKGTKKRRKRGRKKEKGRGKETP